MYLLARKNDAYKVGQFRRGDHRCLYVFRYRLSNAELWQGLSVRQHPDFRRYFGQCLLQLLWQKDAEAILADRTAVFHVPGDVFRYDAVDSSSGTQSVRRYSSFHPSDLDRARPAHFFPQLSIDGSVS